MKAKAVLLILGIWAPSAWAGEPQAPPDDGVRVLRYFRPIFVTFAGYGQVLNPLDQRMGESGEAKREISIKAGPNSDVWLRLHNNTRWAITFRTNSMYIGRKPELYKRMDGKSVPALGEDMQISIQYGLAEENGTPIPSGIDMAWVSLLPPGRSILFSVPRDALNLRRKVYVEFRYEWEDDPSSLSQSRVEHRVVVDSYILPASDGSGEK